MFGMFFCVYLTMCLLFMLCKVTNLPFVYIVIGEVNFDVKSP